MGKKGAVVLAILVVVVLVLGVGGYFGYRWVVSKRAIQAVETAAAFEVGLLEGSAGTIEDVLPPEFADAISEEDLDALAAAWSGGGWEVNDESWDGDAFVVVFGTAEQSDTELEVTFTLSDGASLGEATVEAEYVMSTAEDQTPEASEMDLVWQDGAWRIARYDFEGGTEISYTFFRDGRDADDLAEALHDDLAATAEPTDDGDSDATRIVAGFYDAVIAGDYAKAFAVLPKENQDGWGDAATFGETIAEYGIEGYLFSDVRLDSNNDAMVIIATASTVGGDFSWEWRLEDHGGKWTAVGYSIVSGDSGSGTTPELLPEELEQGELPAGHPDLGDSSD
ncbi:MAG: hypothetical protein CVT59_05435 [Actinobacteria bacterium HGW-Actinobacteria-1]|jgi:hypothetical protein|nr:MAG: hypothetical protein CVT59_05435 [Actinobacteria bacterium HGW-Actinobacteria-1]